MLQSQPIASLCEARHHLITDLRGGQGRHECPPTRPQATLQMPSSSFLLLTDGLRADRSRRRLGLAHEHRDSET